MYDFLARMHSDIESTTRKLELEQRRLYSLDKALATAESEYALKRSKYKIFQNAQDDMVKQAERGVRQLERHLEKSLAELNKGRHGNDCLREQIDQLRRERQVLDTVFRQLERDILANKAQMSDCKRSIIDGKLTGEYAKQKETSLNKMLERERAGFKTEIDNLKVQIQKENDVQKMQENLHTSQVQKGQKEGSNTMQSSSSKGGKHKRAYMIADEEEAFSEQLMYRRILKLSFLNTIQRRHIRQHQKNIEVFEQAFATIKSSTGISDIEKIVEIFITLEQKNFSLLTYVNALNRDIESIEIRNRELDGQLKGHEGQSKTEAERKDAVLNELKIQIEKTQRAAQEKETMIEDAHTALEDCRPLVWNIVKYLKGQLPTLTQAGLDGDTPVMKTQTPDEHEENLNNYLMYIEEAIHQFRFYLQQGAEALVTHPSTKPQPRKDQRGAKPGDLPSAQHDDTDEDDDKLGDVPLTRGELRTRAQDRIKGKRKRVHGRQGDARVEVDDGAGGKGGDTNAGDASGASKKVGEATMKNPSVSAGKQPSDSTPEDIKDEEGDAGDRKELWWRAQGGKEKKK